MKSLVFLVLLLCLCERSVQEVDQKPQRQDDGQGNENEEHGNPLTLCNACSELKELRDMVIEQRLGMQMLKEKLSEQEAELRSTQEELQQQKFDHQILKNELQQQKIDYQALKNEVQQLKSDQETVRMELQRVSSELETVRTENSALSSQITAFESRMVHVEKTLEDNAQQPKVAFSVGLTDSGTVGSFNTDITLVYEKVFYNMGDGYNPATGIFTAPKKGVYYFTFTVYNGGNSPSGLKMYHNQKMLCFTYAYATDSTYNSNAITVQMEEGDVVYLRLPASHYVFDSPGNLSSFTGFLLFAL